MTENLIQFQVNNAPKMEVSKAAQQKDTSNINLYLATCAANLAASAAGCAMTWTSPTLPKLRKPNDRIIVTEDEGAWIGSLLPLGACFGPLLTTLIVDRIGKKCSILICNLILLVHWTMIALFNSLEVIYLARFISGVAAGGIFNLIPIYLAEISSPETRGVTGSVFMLFICIGFCITYIVGLYTSFLTLILVSATVALITILLFVWIPESPYYLLNKQKKQQAYVALQWLRGYPDKSIIQQELSLIQEMLDKSHRENLQSGSSILQIFQSSNLKCLYYACMLIFFQQMAGYNAVIFYSQSIFQQSSSTFSPSVSTIICGLVMLCTGFAVPFIGKVFRIKHILYGSAFGCFFCLTILGIYFYLQERGEAGTSFSWVPIICIVGYIISHSSGLGSYSWVILGEIFHPNVKTLASALTTSFCWLACFFITRFFSTMVDHLGSSGTFGLFAGFCLLALLFLVIQLPDTQGKSFQEIQDMIGGKIYIIGDEIK